jgi:SAM-dependent methyltransferase
VRHRRSPSSSPGAAARTGVDTRRVHARRRRRVAGCAGSTADLADLDLAASFDVVVAAGNVVVYLAEGTEQEVLRRLAGHLVPGGLLVSGWRTDRMAAPAYDALASAAGLVPVERWSTWDADPWSDDADWCVAVHRRPPA